MTTNIETLFDNDFKIITFTDEDFKLTPSCLQIIFNNITENMLNKEWNQSISLCESILDISWEHLNIGHWKDVPDYWRTVYSLASLYKALSCLKRKPLSSSEKVLEILKICDMGILMGSSILGSTLSKLASEVHLHFRRMCPPICNISNAKKQNFKTASPLDNIDRHNQPSLQFFQENILAGKEPAIILSALSGWPALNKWSFAYLSEVAGGRLVPIEIGSSYANNDWSQSLMIIDDFIDKFIVNTVARVDSVGYLAQHHLLNQILELQNDVIVPDYCYVQREKGDVEDDVDDVAIETNVWIGPSGTVSPLHQDKKHNLLCQVVGSKYIRLYDPLHTQELYPHPDAMLKNTSRVDVENPDFGKFPDFKGLSFKDAFLTAGQMLYIPPLYWHYVRSLEPSFSVSFWWD